MPWQLFKTPRILPANLESFKNRGLFPNVCGHKKKKKKKKKKHTKYCTRLRFQYVNISIDYQMKVRRAYTINECERAPSTFTCY